MTTNRSQGARAKATPKGKATAKAPSKHFLMPTVDLGGLGGEDGFEELPPLDLAPFSSKAPASTPTEWAAAPSMPGQDRRQPPPAPSQPPSVSKSTTVTPSSISAEANVETPREGTIKAAPSQQFAAPPVTRGPGDPTTLDSLSREDTGAVSSSMASVHGSPATSGRTTTPTSTSPALWKRTAGPPEAKRWSSTAPARRLRHTTSHAFSPGQIHSRREERLRELLAKAPCYASLLQSYTIAQSGKETYQNRNIQLYGLTAQALADRITVDKAVMTAMNLPTPRFTPAHYLDAVLERALGALDPRGTDLNALETDRDVVWELAHDGLAYRDYVFTDLAVAALKKPRSQCPLRTGVNQRVSRMMDILKTMSDLKTQPFEIISACLAKYLQELQAEQPAFEEFWNQSLETGYK